MNTVYTLLKKTKMLFTAVICRLLIWLPDTVYLKMRFRLLMGYPLNLDSPKTFNEKINWLKIYNRNPLYPSLVDKSTVKDYVAKKIGAEYVIPTYGVWDSFDEIDFDSLPDQFVLKSTNGGGGTGVVICRDKSKLDKAESKKALELSMNTNTRISREWPYQFIKPRIIAEKLMTSSSQDKPKDLPDYKFYCFNGEPKFCQIIRNRTSNETIDFYDMDWNHQSFTGLTEGAVMGNIDVERPAHLDEMKSICKKLSESYPFVRVDLYVVDEKEYFGELTFFPNAGIGTFNPEEWNNKFGELLNLQGVNGGGITV